MLNSVESYIHRAGRTARYTSTGKALLLLLPSEAAMVDKLEAGKVPVKEVFGNPGKVKTITPRLAAQLSQDREFHVMAQRALVAYVRSVHVQADKAIFKVDELPIAEYALSMGLPSAPRVRFAETSSKKDKGRRGGGGGGDDDDSDGDSDESSAASSSSSSSSSLRSVTKKTAGDSSGDEDSDDDSSNSSSSSSSSGGDDSSSSSSSSSSSESKVAAGRGRTKLDRLFGRRANPDANTLVADDSADEDGASSESGLVTLKRRDHKLDGDLAGDEDGKPGKGTGKGKSKGAADADADDADNTVVVRELTRTKRRKLLSRNPDAAHQRTVFNEEGEAVPAFEALASKYDENAPLSSEDEEGKNDDDERRPAQVRADRYAASARAVLAEADREDREVHRERVREKHRRERHKERARRRGDAGAEDDVVELAGGDDASSGSDDEDRSASSRGSPAGRRRGGGSGGGLGSDSDANADTDSDSDSSVASYREFVQRNAEKAARAAKAADNDASSTKDKKKGKKDKDASKKAKSGTAMSIEDQEKLALEMLGV
jgi:ATP-dependent RNA helicase DDX10/DBP4